MAADTSEIRLVVPTYNYQLYGEQVDRYELPEFGEPHVPVLIHEAEGVRIVLGTHDYNDYSKPDIQIERRPNGWAIFLHPEGGGDPSGVVYFLDDGRSFVTPENDLGSSNNIQFLECGEPVPDIDGPQRARSLKSSPLRAADLPWVVNDEVD
jgi:hypothetical protein